MTKFSIVVHEGVYYDDLTVLCNPDPNKFLLEIIGLGGVFVYLITHEIRVARQTLTLKNLIIVNDNRQKTAAILVENNGWINMERVWIQSSYGVGLHVRGKGSYAGLIKCAIVGSPGE